MDYFRLKESGISFKEAKKDFDAAMRIYEEAFPSRERQLRRVIEKRVTTGSEHLWVGKEGGKVVFMSLVFPLSGVDYLLLDYMAVSEDMRGKGIGMSFIEMLAHKVVSSGKSVVLEVEDPSSGDNVNQRKRRITFYRRSGAKMLKGMKYLLPPLDGTKPTDMLLFAYPLGSTSSLSGNSVRKLVSALYEQVYGMDLHHPLVAKTMSTIGERIALV